MNNGDKKNKCSAVAAELGIVDIRSEKLPQEKLEEIKTLQNQSPISYVGDGVNDALALSAASVGISFGEASGTAIASASAVVLSNDFTKIIELYHLSKITVTVIKQNLFWAFFYNILMIPLAAGGFLAPSFAALAMALSDVFVIGNSLRLRSIKLK